MFPALAARKEEDQKTGAGCLRGVHDGETGRFSPISQLPAGMFRILSRGCPEIRANQSGPVGICVRDTDEGYVAISVPVLYPPKRSAQVAEMKFGFLSRGGTPFIDLHVLHRVFQPVHEEYKMQTTTLSFSNFHQHGELFANILRARRDSFIVKRRWDLPQTEGMEFYQYDTPASRWLAVHSDTGEVLAGARLTPTTAQCGIYSYMVRDAQRGLLESIPTNLLDTEAPIEAGIWEVTRGFISQNIPDTKRLRVRLMLIALMMQAAREEGIGQMIALLPANWTRWSARAKLDVEPAGPVMEMGGVSYQAVWINCTNHLH